MASFQTFRLVPMRRQPLDDKDEWAGLSDAKERRKRQNRLNQREARRRHRQRLIQTHEQESRGKPIKPEGFATCSNLPLQERADATAVSTVPEVYFPLTRDSQLLHVISFNVSRAILTNYFILSTVPLSTPSFCSVWRVFSLPSSQEVLPPCLIPTQMQQNSPHPGWIDLFPCAQLRDNLILALGAYPIDEDAFMIDLVGEAFDSLCGGEQVENELEIQSRSDPSAQSCVAGIPRNENAITVAGGTWIGEPGLISWSDPWDIAGWEVTEAFTKKWAFLLQGCSDVVTAANTWREMRGDDLLVVAT
ncbi:hypothetical protein ACJZ2D_000694 [Fusarium nematophilum]